MPRGTAELCGTLLWRPQRPRDNLSSGNNTMSTDNNKPADNNTETHTGSGCDNEWSSHISPC